MIEVSAWSQARCLADDHLLQLCRDLPGSEPSCFDNHLPDLPALSQSWVSLLADVVCGLSCFHAIGLEC